MKIPFTKMHGCGNDYIYVNAMEHHIDNPYLAAREWSDRHKGIGSDGLVLIDRSPVPEADFSMRIFNADGSEAMMCGNASRCIAKYLYERGLTKKEEIKLLTLSGIKLLSLHLSQPDEESSSSLTVASVTVDMLEPILTDDSLFVASRDIHEGTFVSMGNPHYVIFTDDVDKIGEVGPALEIHPAFPQRCNIEMAQVLPDGRIRTRVWERGSGITMACGTGACATAVAASLNGLAPRHSQIVMDGGTLTIDWPDKSDAETGFKANHVYMTGPAEFVYDGEIILNV